MKCTPEWRERSSGTLTGSGDRLHGGRRKPDLPWDEDIGCFLEPVLVELVVPGNCPYCRQESTAASSEILK